MKSIIDEIYNIRNGCSLAVDRENQNRYCLVSIDSDSLNTAYVFGVPIYNNLTGRLVDLKFHRADDHSELLGSNANITVGDSIVLKNEYGNFEICMPKGCTYRDEHCISYLGTEVYPTTNGVALKVMLNGSKKFNFRINTTLPFPQIKHNGKYFSLMREPVIPFATISCIGAMDNTNYVIASAAITYTKLNDKEFDITVISSSPNAKFVLLEINLQEEKLFQDTTVESKNPDANNVFGGTAFIGTSGVYGEQWLYSRMDFSKISEFFSKDIRKVHIYYPIFNRSDLLLSAHKLTKRFCSFGSTWNKRINSAEEQMVSQRIYGYHRIDITKMVIRNQSLSTQFEGWIIKSKIKSSGFSVVSTGDCFFAPLILEIQYKN